MVPAHRQRTAPPAVPAREEGAPVDSFPHNRFPMRIRRSRRFSTISIAPTQAESGTHVGFEAATERSVGLLQIVGLLEIQPEAFTGAKEASEAEGRVDGDGTTTLRDLGEARGGKCLRGVSPYLARAGVDQLLAQLDLRLPEQKTLAP